MRSRIPPGLLSFFVRTHDHDGATGVLRALLADRAEEQALEPTETPGTHDEKVRVPACFDEDLCG